MSTFISALRNGAKLLERRDDDGFDRLSNRYSVGKFFFVAFVALKKICQRFIKLGQLVTINRLLH